MKKLNLAGIEVPGKLLAKTAKSQIAEKIHTLTLTLDSQKSDAAVVKIHNTKKAVAITCDCNPIYCNANPFQGSMLAVVETWRNLCAVGSKPLAITDNLNFGQLIHSKGK